MSKNLTRKGLAFGALVALGSSVVAGAPANAAAPTSLAIGTSYGTSYSTILGQGFDLAVTSNGGAVAADKVKLYIEGATAAELSSTIPGLTSSTDLSTSTGSTGDVADVVAVSDADKTAVVVASGAAVGGNGVALSAGTYNQFLLSLNNTVTATRTIKVTPFVDSAIANGKPDAASTLVPTAETKGNTVEITFVKASEVTATTTISTTIGANGTASAVVKLDKGINLEQMRNGNSLVTVDFKVNGAAGNTDTSVEWNKADAGLVAEGSSLGTIAKNKVYSAQAKINGTASGNLATATVSEGATNVIEADLIVNNFVTATKGANVLRVNDNTYSVRKGTTTVSIATGAIKKATSSTDLTPISVGAGVPAKVTITANAVGTGSTFSAGGKTVDTATGTATFTTTTNADSKVVFDLTATGAAGDDAKIQIEILDVDTYRATDEVFFSWAAATPNATAVLLDAVGTTDTTASSTVSSVAVLAGGSYTLNFALYDNFGALYTGTDRWLQATGGSVTKFVDGKASITRNDSNVAAATNAIYYSVTSTDTVATPTSGQLVNVYAQTNITAGFLTASNSGNPVPGTATYAAGDARNGSSTYAWSSTDKGTAAIVSGTVLNTTGVAIKGTPVTISGAGLLIVDGYQSVADDKVWALGSLTVLTDETGAYSVKVYSNKSGKQEVKVTAGAVSATTTPEWAAADAATASAITITAPTSTAPGTTAAIVVKLTDAKGNAVKTDGSTAISFTVRVSGAGTPGTINEYTNADGETRFNVVVGSGETGSFKVTVTYDADKASTASAPITKEAVVTIAAAAAPVVVEPTSKIGTANSRVYVNVKDGKGAVVSVKIGAKWYTKTSLNNDYTFSFKAKKKSKVSVKVYVDGDLSSSKTITVK